MPDSMETSYTDWVGRKRAKLKRSTLDCGCPNDGEVSYHLWCDRLACQEHADALHDCGLFKGKSSSEGEAVEPEAVVDPPAPRPLTLSPETYRALYGQDVAVVSMPVATTVHYELHQPEAAAPPVDGLRPFFTTALDGEADTFAERVSAALDELVEPDPDVPRCILASCVEVGRHNHLEPPPSTSLYCAGCGRDITYSGVCSRCPEPPWAAEMRARMARDTRPWWRRMLPGGAR